MTREELARPQVLLPFCRSARRVRVAGRQQFASADVDGGSHLNAVRKRYNFFVTPNNRRFQSLFIPFFTSTIDLPERCGARMDRVHRIRYASVRHHRRARENTPHQKTGRRAALERVHLQQAARALNQIGRKALAQTARTVQIANDVHLISLPRVVALAARLVVAFHRFDFAAPAFRIGVAG